MIEYLKKVSAQVVDFVRGLSPGKKMAMAFTMACVLGGILALFLWAGDKTYQPLMTNLNPEDSANIIRILRDKHIPFKVDPSGKNISIPPEDLYQLRLELASLGMPQNSVVGYEVFDKQSLGTTSFVQKVNQKRALEGELIRTINTIKGVHRSRVHLALPQKSAFVEDQKKPTASVILDLDPGTVLGDKQIYGIGNLVAKAVEGMDVNDVSIVDSNGKLLSKNTSDPLAAATATQFDFRQKLEQDTEKRIEEMLGRVVGDGHVVARVTADVDFSQVRETQTTYDGDASALKSRETDVKSMDGTRPGPVGAAGAASNTPGVTPPVPLQVKSNTKTDHETVNFAIPETVRNTVKPLWQVRKLSVAVVVDEKTIKETDKDGKVLSKAVPWSPEKLKEFEELIAGAAGIDKKRGDTLEIKTMEFTHEDFEEANRMIADAEKKSYIQNIVLYSVIGMIVLLFFLLVVRPFIKWITENTTDSVDSFLPQTIEELERMQRDQALPGLEEAVPVLPEKIDPEKVEGEMIKEKIVTLVDANPHKAALILKDWLHAEAKKKPSDEGGKGKSA